MMRFCNVIQSICLIDKAYCSGLKFNKREQAIYFVVQVEWLNTTLNQILPDYHNSPGRKVTVAGNISIRATRAA